MKLLLTLVASSDELPITDELVVKIGKLLINIVLDRKWLQSGKALELTLEQKPASSQLTQLENMLVESRVDYFIQPAQPAKKKLLLADMDNTMVVGETLDDLAGEMGLKREVAEITEKAMQGKIDFPEALKERVALLGGLPVSALTSTCEKMVVSSGAKELTNSLRQAGVTCVLVSGGFTSFTKVIAEQLGFNYHHGNVLEIDGEQLTGKVLPPILDSNAKRDYLHLYIEKLGLQPEEVLAIGDGANDLFMLREAGLGIGYHPKPPLKAELDNNLLYGDLSSLLFLQSLIS